MYIFVGFFSSFFGAQRRKPPQVLMRPPPWDKLKSGSTCGGPGEGFHWGIPTGLVFSLMESPETKGTWMIYIGVPPKTETSRFCHIGMGLAPGQNHFDP